MLFKWNAQTLKWYREASDYSGYSRRMAELLLPHLADCDTLCDIGCGPGLVDLVLAPHLRRMICVDIAPVLTEYIQSCASAAGLDNVEALCMEGADAPSGCDAVMALFHGAPEKTVPAYLAKARKRLILAVHSSPVGNTGPEGYRVQKCSYTEKTTDWLDAMGYQYDISFAELEFGQPHRDLADAAAYTRTYCREMPEETLMEYVKEHALPTGRDDFPLYSFKTRSFGLYILERQKNEHLL
jgi:hypothetical protein